MDFLLFSKLPFEVKNPEMLIECYCFQTNFYSSYDAIATARKRKIEDVNNIGARIPTELLPKCTEIINRTKDLQIFNFIIDTFLGQKDEDADSYIRALHVEVIQKLTRLNGIRLSTATKILHTLYPGIIPIIDNTLQKKYKELNPGWMENDYFQILSDYYKNLKIETNWINICQLNSALSETGLVLSKIRIFDIIWWSYLKSQNPIQGKIIKWASIK
jgi:hypothetical protein